jgi:hypothetical protein
MLTASVPRRTVTVGWARAAASSARSRSGCAKKLDVCRAVGVAPFVPVVVGLDDGVVVRTDAYRLEDAGHLVVEVDGARHRVGVGVPLDDHDVVALSSELRRQELSDGPVPDDDDVVDTSIG